MRFTCRMPASWSSAAELHFSGGGHQLTTETRGQTAFWTITPERPVWGSQRLVLRSSRPLQADREITYPEISPLGRGAVDACLAVVNATGRPATIENPVGLERIEYSSRFQAREFAAPSGVRARCVSGGQRVADSQGAIAPRHCGCGRFARRIGSTGICRRDGRGHARPFEPGSSHVRAGSRQRLVPVVRASPGQHASVGDRRLEPRHSAPVELRGMVDRAGREPAAPRQSDLADTARVDLRSTAIELVRRNSQGRAGDDDEPGDCPCPGRVLARGRTSAGLETDLAGTPGDGPSRLACSEASTTLFRGSIAAPIAITRNW